MEPVPGQTHGVAGRQEEAIQQVEQAAQAIPRAATPPVVPLDAPTEFPDEPVTAGLSIGPGPGPEALGARPGGAEDTDAILRELFAAHPSEGLADLIDWHQRRLPPPQATL